MQKLYVRVQNPDRLVGPELGRELTEVAQQCGRQVGLLIDRKGEIRYVVVGTSQALLLPSFGRGRAGTGRLCGIRLVHVHLHGEPLSTDDLTDLSLLSLDAVAVLEPGGRDGWPTISWSHLLPENPSEKQWEVVKPVSILDIDLDFRGFIRELEAEFGRKAAAQKTSRRDKAILVHLDGTGSETVAWDVAELQDLARTAGLDVVDTVVQRRKADPNTLIGRGKLTDLIIRGMQKHVDLLVFSPSLTPAQVKSISNLAEIRVIDRTQLILDIFAQRARSADGKVQVELAQLKHLMPRLVGTGKAMSRLMGGIGGRGPGETKLEVDRRRINERIVWLQRALEKLAQERQSRRRRRQRSRLPVISIVGYTNAGKSTLLNTLTHAEALAEDKLFATLDPFSKRLRFPQDREVVLTDTVGFIRNLPPTLLQAFRSTLEELSEADLFIHVVDASSPHRDAQKESVEEILQEMELASTRTLTVYNKLDRLEDQEELAILLKEPDTFGISARERSTMGPLLEKLLEFVDELEMTRLLSQP